MRASAPSVSSRQIYLRELADDDTGHLQGEPKKVCRTGNLVQNPVFLLLGILGTMRIHLSRANIARHTQG
jgi:hypothetical protein